MTAGMMAEKMVVKMAAWRVEKTVMQLVWVSVPEWGLQWDLERAPELVCKKMMEQLWVLRSG